MYCQQCDLPIPKQVVSNLAAGAPAFWRQIRSILHKCVTQTRRGEKMKSHYIKIHIQFYVDSSKIPLPKVIVDPKQGDKA